MQNFGKEILAHQAITSTKFSKREKRQEEIAESDRTPKKDHQKTEIIKEKTPISPKTSPKVIEKKDSAPRVIKKKILSTDSDSSISSKPKPKKEKSKPKSRDTSSGKKKTDNLVKRKPKKVKKDYESDEEIISESESPQKIVKKTKENPNNQKKTKKLQLDDSDLELMQKNKKILSKEEGRDTKKSKKPVKKRGSSESDDLSDFIASESGSGSDSDY